MYIVRSRRPTVYGDPCILNIDYLTKFVGDRDINMALPVFHYRVGLIELFKPREPYRLCGGATFGCECEFTCRE